MFVRRDVPWSWTLYYAWPSMLYFLALATTVYLLRTYVDALNLEIPFAPVAIMGTALAIFLGFKNNEAYGRWWEARIIWGLAVNYSRAWARQVLTLMEASAEEKDSLQQMQHRMIYRHLAFIHALRVYLRSMDSFPHADTSDEPGSHNDYHDCAPFLSDAEYRIVCQADNPPEALLQMQGRDLRSARNQEGSATIRWFSSTRP